MHFFNPAPVMRLLEVIAGVQSSERALAVARATGAAMGKQVIDAADGPGFLVNRCNRPFGLEALRLLSERVADIETIDRICRMAGGFRMGPFELMDLVGIDTGLEISRSFYEQSFYEPRWRPSPISARYVAAGLFGRKSGRGYYDYSGEQPHRPEDPPPPSGPPALSIVPTPSDDPTEQPIAESSTAKPRGDGVVVISGEGVLAHELRAAAQAAGYRVCTPGEAYGELPSLIVECGPGRGARRSAQALTPADRAVLAAGSLARARSQRQRRRLSRLAAVRRRRCRGADPLRALRPDGRRARRALLHDARQAHRVGRRRAGARARADRLPGDQRVGVRARRRCRQCRRHRHRDGARAQATRAARLPGPTRSASITCWPCSTR